MAAEVKNGHHAQVSITNSEVAGEKNKKFAVYKVVVNYEGKMWFLLRRYNEFHHIYDILKKAFPNETTDLKLPGKRIFGNNLDPAFIRHRTEGLHMFIQKIMNNLKLCNHPEVRAFLQLDDPRHTDAEEDAEHNNSNNSTAHDNNVLDAAEQAEAQDMLCDLGTSEKRNVKPSDFEFLKVIGKGSFGKVFVARHKSEQTVYAIKVLQKKMIMRRNEVKHIMAERNVLLKNVCHPFLVGLHYSFQTQDKLYFVLDFVNGGELFFHLQRERYFAEPRAKFYAAEMASAIGYLHSLDIIYRDLKPENILLDSDGHIKLTDFGLCKEGIEQNRTTSTFCGTPEYLAPEVLRKRPYDRAVDWWCLGAVLYEMLYGLPPFYSRDTAEMYDNILNKPLRLRTNISLAARNILEGLLQKERDKRLGFATGFPEVRDHQFFHTLSWDDILAKRVTPPFRPNVKSPLDIKCFDPEFTKEVVPESVGRNMDLKGVISASVQEADEAFMGFSYAPAVLE